ncbi:MAG TPA: phosphoglycerate mutase family protein, partial [Candidatus Acidoferrum sp.]|nr:phosphoglycerate mutase family protein [Candidatus Acidoferrum sp.]
RRRMLLGRFAVLLGLSVLPGNSCFSQEKPTTVLIVRHAEKSAPKGDIPLSPAGFERAEVLSRVLADANITAIYTSEFIRTVQTAEPIAKRLNLVPKQIYEVNALAKDILEHHAGQTILVVHHSDTVPELIKILGADTNAQIDDNEFDKLFVVTVYAPHRASVLILRYGKSTP